MAASIRALPFWSTEEVEAALSHVIAHLQTGRIIAYPTETVYGFGGAAEERSVERIVALKQRPAGKPFLLLIAEGSMIERLGLHLTLAASRLAAHHWPGPLTLVLPGGERRVPDGLRGPEGGVAVRWTPHAGLNRLIRAFGRPITSTSANRPRQPPASSAGEVLTDWPAEVTSGDVMVLDGGTLAPSRASTVVDCTGPRPRVIRPGAIPASVLRLAVPDLVGDV